MILTACLDRRSRRPRVRVRTEPSQQTVVADACSEDHHPGPELNLFSAQEGLYALNYVTIRYKLKSVFAVVQFVCCMVHVTRKPSDDFARIERELMRLEELSRLSPPSPEALV